MSLDSKILSITSGDPASASTFLDSVLESSESRVPLVGFLTILDKNPDLLPKCQQVAQVSLKNGDLGPTNAIWCHYLLTGRMEEADSVWDSLKSSTKIFFAPVARFAKEKGDEVLAEKLVKCLTSVTSEGITSTAVGLAYSSWIDILGNYFILIKLILKNYFWLLNFYFKIILVFLFKIFKIVFVF